MTANNGPFEERRQIADELRRLGRGLEMGWNAMPHRPRRGFTDEEFSARMLDFQGDYIRPADLLVRRAVELGVWADDAELGQLVRFIAENPEWFEQHANDITLETVAICRWKIWRPGETFNTGPTAQERIETYIIAMEKIADEIEPQPGENGNWTPPENMTRANEVRASDGSLVPRTTVQKWAENDPPSHQERGPTGAVYYPDDWLAEHIAKWEDRKKRRKRKS